MKTLMMALTVIALSFVSLGAQAQPYYGGYGYGGCGGCGVGCGYDYCGYNYSPCYYGGCCDTCGWFDFTSWYGCCY